mmetsp:Transcript_9039/g.22091  ORF Transcript_9039/g.22091 Transcript_9039/m.22091 type:complete len:288 (-) Transcript_9039:2422-3285(-)
MGRDPAAATAVNSPWGGERRTSRPLACRLGRSRPSRPGTAARRPGPSSRTTRRSGGSRSRSRALSSLRPARTASCGRTSPSPWGSASARRGPRRRPTPAPRRPGPRRCTRIRSPCRSAASTDSCLHWNYGTCCLRRTSSTERGRADSASPSRADSAVSPSCSSSPAIRFGARTRRRARSTLRLAAVFPERRGLSPSRTRHRVSGENCRQEKSSGKLRQKPREPVPQRPSESSSRRPRVVVVVVAVVLFLVLHAAELLPVLVEGERSRSSTRVALGSPSSLPRSSLPR